MQPSILKSLHILTALTLGLTACTDDDSASDDGAQGTSTASDTEAETPAADSDTPADTETPAEETETGTEGMTPLEEAQLLLEVNAARLGVEPGFLSGADDPARFTPQQNVFLKSTIAVDNLEDPDAATATLPLYEGVRPNGEIALYVLTEAADFEVARLMGLNYAPRMRFGKGTPGAMEVQIDDEGRMVFRGDVDFSPERFVEAGDLTNPDNAFPPNPDTLQPGAVADIDWSSLVVTPAGNVFNVQQVQNSTGTHDRVVAINGEGTKATLQLLDGFQGGEQLYYHLVTDASDPAPAAIELGVYAPRLASLPAFGSTMVNSESALLGFSPIVNGLTGVDNPERQGLGSTLLDLIPGTQTPSDPINVFPLDPDNLLEEGNNYSPMWDAHLSMWTDEAINGPNGDVRRRVTGIADLAELVNAGLITSVAADGPSDGFIAGLNSAGAIINCPVIAQPIQ